MSQTRTKLPNGCSRSEISITPKNWKSLKKAARPWRIHYRFYDPSQPKALQVTLKTMNKYKDIAQRKAATELIIETEKQVLESGYNPFLKKVISQSENRFEVSDKTLFIPALRKALARVPLEEKTRKEIDGYIIESMARAAANLNYGIMFISEIKRKHIIFMLDYLRQTNAGFTNNTFNHFRKYLRILFGELTEIDVIESNIIKDIKVRPKEDETERELLNDKQRKFVNDLLATKYPAFHRFLHIFFHSGARITELMKVKGCHVELEEQRYKIVIKKGRNPRTVWRTIKNIAIPFWREALEGCGPDGFVFSRGLRPGDTQIRPDQITKRWYRLIKQKEFEIDGKKITINSNFYWLKHLHTTELMDVLENSSVAPEKIVAEHNAHTSSAMVVSIYDQKQKQRKHNKVKVVNNPFA